MDRGVYWLRAANGKWPNQIGADLLYIRVTGSTREKAIAAAQRILREQTKLTYDHAWLKDDDGWTVWASAEDGFETVINTDDAQPERSAQTP